eukprot:12803081-Alexandrium_andersonii.AAC.1
MDVDPHCETEQRSANTDVDITVTQRKRAMRVHRDTNCTPMGASCPSADVRRLNCTRTQAAVRPAS